MQTINGVIEKARRVADKVAKMQNPAIIGQAMQNRRDMLVNGRVGR